MGVADPDRGQNVAAAIVADDGEPLSADELKQRVKGDLSAYKVPKHVWIFPDGTLPFTDSGKIDKRRLKALLEARIAEGDAG